MQIAQVLAGYTLGGADLLRRAMGKKKPEEMAKQRSIFEEGARQQGVDPELAIRIFDLVEKFAGYGFNKSHSAAYALVSYHTAWLKVHYPAPFMAAVMSSEMHNTDKVVIMIEECKEMGITLRLPDINEGHYRFSVNSSAEVVYGLGAIKGLGEGPVGSILDARAEGPFTSLYDFCERTDPRRMNKRAIEALIRCGAFDDLGTDRAILMASMDGAMLAAEQSAHNRASGVDDLFGDIVSEDADNDPYAPYRATPAMSARARLQGERDTLGLYVTGHPIDEYIDEIRRFAPKRLNDLRADGKSKQTAAGLVVGIRTMKTKRGDTMAIVQLDDRSARLEVTIYAETYMACRELLLRDNILIIEGSVVNDEYSGGISMRADACQTLLAARRKQVSTLTIEIGQDSVDEHFAQRLGELLETGRGGECPVTLVYNQRHNRANLQLGDYWQVHPSDELLEQLRQQYGQKRVNLSYPQ